MTVNSAGLHFPDSFLWGTATASHQVEGNNSNSDWWAWEQGGHVLDGTRSGLACDHYHRFREDFDLLAALHQNAHRLSLEWSRIEPSPGEFDRTEIRHYREVLEHLRRLNIEPVVTLHHFTNPVWLAERGGWEVPEVVDAYGRYVQEAVAAFGDLVRYWVTINEPVIYGTMGYLAGAWPPGKRSFRGIVNALHNMILGHARAARIIRDRSPRGDVQIGIAHHLRIFDPYRPILPGDRFVARLGEVLFNRAVLLSLLKGQFQFPFGWGRVPDGADSLDFIGLNYYSREMATFDFRRPETYFGSFFPHPSRPKTAAGWEIYPEGMYRVLKFLTQFGKPILITENGVADERDELRPAFLISHLQQIYRAISEGVPVKGYLHWSALDNFEWAEGRRLRFGLIHVDYETLRRTVKPSGELYAKICAAGGIEPSVLAAHP
ncbi:MAG TPA: glycoside hydrolase family 1 protein [Chloroflexota bacterium]|nr:glycoside hydrolase family 1 protein [Chloroflexota bacterium]